ncbi:MAG: UxaA family hydrolase [Candidatus Pacebacteria bacterium]|nr:UxaA family hydrolase [Candidatus Paceibacterota bacterium]
MTELDKRLILLSPEDNCLVAAADLPAGSQVLIDGEQVTLPHTVYLGHKCARYDLRQNDKIIKYGAAIGHVTVDSPIGEHLHLHNLVSDYIPTYTHEAGAQFVSHPSHPSHPSP